MTLKTLSGPSVQAALADARRLFGAAVVLLQSAPAAGGAPAQITVAFDEAPRPPRPAPAAPAVPASEPAAPRAYGYAAARNDRPPTPEPFSAPTAPARPSPMPPPADPQPSPELTAMRSRVAALEAELARRAATAPARPALVFVGPAGAGKSSLALRLAARPGLVGAASAAALVVAPDHPFTTDATPAFWELGAPAVRVETAADVTAAQELTAGADLVIVDTPALPLDPAQAAVAVRRLADVLAPLAPLEVVFVVDAPRAGDALSAETVAGLGLVPDGLAVTRLDETDAPADAWAEHLGVPLRFASASPTPDGLRVTPAPAVPDARFLAPDAAVPLTPPRDCALADLSDGSAEVSPLSSPVLA